VAGPGSPHFMVGKREAPLTSWWERGEESFRHSWHACFRVYFVARAR